ncbi:protein Dok-7 isoform X3 [Balaenoptera ricei]|uniref:protein Dok-7 isoform X3 n=1 Tax=Balaenoptera ricei TaxID=2746895 RepID=UPI0028BE4A77|nr:protein Dok-7 isoform X3 [Balaenoptera ricei]
MTEDDRGGAGGGPDCLLMLAYKDRAERARGMRERSSLALEDICGLEPGLPYEGLAHTLAIVCLSQAIMLGFDSREAMCAWDARIRHALGEVHRFHVTVAPGTKLESGPATLHLCNDILVVARDVPPAVTGQWKLSDLRRYGAVPSGFIFEGGTRCGYWAGVFFLSSAEGEQISFLFDCIVRGISPTKGPFGLRPVLPDLSPGGPAAEERVAQEALETLQLEKRLSLLSHSGWPGSAGDDRSLSSSSSEASHSDVSASSRLAPWPEPSPSSAGASPEGLGLAAAQAPGEAAAGASRPPPRPLRPRQLQEVGRQSSSDSGIATGSHSSYSGSFSSFAGSSLDVWRGADELGSLLSLPGGGAPERSLCACAPGAAEYQVPAAPRPHYDTPRSVRQAARDQPPATQGSASDGAAGDSGGRPSAGCPSGWLGERRRGQATEAPSGPGEPWEVGAPHAGPPPALFSACPVCGGLKGAAASPPGLPVMHSGPERPCSEGPTYVNVPASPSPTKQLHYLGLQLQEAGAGIRDRHRGHRGGAQGGGPARAGPGGAAAGAGAEAEGDPAVRRPDCDATRRLEGAAPRHLCCVPAVRLRAEGRREVPPGQVSGGSRWT